MPILEDMERKRMHYFRTHAKAQEICEIAN